MGVQAMALVLGIAETSRSRPVTDGCCVPASRTVGQVYEDLSFGARVLCAAVHEAGHVVAEYALGHRISAARVDAFAGGRTWLGWWAWRPPDDAVVAALAGPAAEAMWLDVPLEAVLGSPGSDRDRIAVTEWLQPGQEQATYERIAAELVAGCWAAVARVAAELVVRRRLGHRRVARLLLETRRREVAACVTPSASPAAAEAALA